MFVYSDVDPIAKEDQMAICVDRAFQSKDAIIEWYARELSFPYWAPNWDSFHDCMRDLEWIDKEELIVVHKAVPLTASERDLRIYLNVLYSAVSTRNRQGGRPLLEVRFPIISKTKVEERLEIQS